MTTSYTLHVGFLAPIPVGHRIQIDFFEHDVGIYSKMVVLDRDAPTIKDLETGIRWSHSSHFSRSAIPLRQTPHRKHKSTQYGRVMGCQVVTLGGENARVDTELLIEPMDAPAHRRTQTRPPPLPRR